MTRIYLLEYKPKLDIYLFIIAFEMVMLDRRGTGGRRAGVKMGG